MVIVSATGTSLFGAEEWASASNAAAQTVALLPTARFAPSQQGKSILFVSFAIGTSNQAVISSSIWSFDGIRLERYGVIP